MKAFKKTLVTSVVTIMICALLAVALAQVNRGGSEQYFTGLFNGSVACNFDEDSSETSYTLTTDKGKEYTVVFREDTELPIPGTIATLQGFRKGSTIFASKAYINPPQGDLAGQAHQSHGEQKIVIALVNFQNDLTENVTVEQVEARMWDPAYSANEWWLENSYGKTWSSGDVFGWLTLPMDRACNASLIRSLTIQALDPLTNLTQYNRLYILIPGAGGCSWGGLGTLGFSTYNTDDGPWTTTTSWTRSEYFNETLFNQSAAVFVTAHEFGHNFGQHHSSSVTWASGQAVGPFDCSGCDRTQVEYGDPFSSLGGSWRTGHFNAVVKSNLDWFEPENVLPVNHSGVYEIDAYELTSNVSKTLKIVRGFAPTAGKYEYLDVEWRQPIGFDTHINWFSGVVYDGVVMHYEWTPTNRTFMPDMTPGDNELKNAALPTGSTWSDAYTNLSVTPLGVVNHKMQVQVDLGHPVLVDAVHIVRGNHASGGLPELHHSDDQRYSAFAGATLFPGESPIWLEFEGTHSGAVPIAFQFEVESSSLSALTQKIYLYDFHSSQWVDVGATSQTQANDTFALATVWTNGGRFVEAGTGKMRARVQYWAAGPSLHWPWSARVDQAVWKILR